MAEVTLDATDYSYLVKPLAGSALYRFFVTVTNNSSLQIADLPAFIQMGNSIDTLTKIAVWWKGETSSDACRLRFARTPSTTPRGAVSILFLTGGTVSGALYVYAG